MNLGDGLLFELENGKPRLILLGHVGEKYPAKLSFRPRAANILSSRQPSCAEETHGAERPARQPAGRHREARSKAGGGGGGAATSCTSNGTTTEGRSSTAASKMQEHLKPGSVRAVAKLKSDRHKLSSTVGPLRAKTEQPQHAGTPGGGKAGLKDALTSRDTGPKDGVVCLTNEQLQKILNTVQTSRNDHQPPEDLSTRGSETGSKSGGGGEMEEDDRGGGGEPDPTGSSQEKDSRSGCLFSWMEERQSESRAAIDAKKAQWKRELDEQVALKQQQRSAPDRLQAEEDAESVLSVQSVVSHREQPAAIRSSLKLGEVSPMAEALGVERKEEQRRRWLEELDRQREETTERRKREKLLQNQTEDHELWTTHFDSLQRRSVQPVAPSAQPPAQFSGSERGDWEPSSSLSLVWEATSSCGADSIGGASVDTAGGFLNRTSYLRTMTSLLDPAQIEERERRRLKQLEQQRAIEAQMEERRQQREREEARRRREEEEEDRRVALEREMMQRQYELESQKAQSLHQAEQPEKGPDDDDDDDDGTLQETLEPGVTKQAKSLEDTSTSSSSYRDTAVQTEAADRLQTPPPPQSAAPPPNSRSRATRTGKENICLPAGGDPYEPFARTERSRRDKRRPEWNTQRPSRRFVPASERYPAALQKNRYESRLKRQAELLALQERTCLSRTEPPPQHQELRLCSNPPQSRTSPNRKVEAESRGQNVSAAINAERGRSPPVPAVRHRVLSQQPSSTAPPPVLEFIPYVRTDEVFNLDPLEPAGTPPVTQSGAPPPPPAASSHRDPLLRHAHTHRQQEILRGLAQLRQRLLQKQRELEMDLNPLLKRHDNEHRPPSTTHRM